MAAPNWANRTIWTGDNLDIMWGTNSECVDLSCLDPPFNLNRNYAAPSVTTGGKAEVVGERPCKLCREQAPSLAAKTIDMRTPASLQRARACSRVVTRNCVMEKPGKVGMNRIDAMTQPRADRRAVPWA